MFATHIALSPTRMWIAFREIHTQTASESFKANIRFHRMNPSRNTQTSHKIARTLDDHHVSLRHIVAH